MGFNCRNRSERDLFMYPRSRYLSHFNKCFSPVPLPTLHLVNTLCYGQMWLRYYSFFSFSFLFSFPFLLSFSPPFHITAWCANTQRTGDARAFFIPDVSHIRQEQSHNCFINKNRQFWNFVPPRIDGENVDGTITCVSSRTVFFRFHAKWFSHTYEASAD